MPMDEKKNFSSPMGSGQVHILFPGPRFHLTRWLKRIPMLPWPLHLHLFISQVPIPPCQWMRKRSFRLPWVLDKFILYSQVQDPHHTRWFKRIPMLSYHLYMLLFIPGSKSHPSKGITCRFISPMVQRGIIFYSQSHSHPSTDSRSDFISPMVLDLSLFFSQSQSAHTNGGYQFIFPNSHMLSTSPIFVMSQSRHINASRKFWGSQNPISRDLSNFFQISIPHCPNLLVFFFPNSPTLP